MFCRQHALSTHWLRTWAAEQSSLLASLRRDGGFALFLPDLLLQGQFISDVVLVDVVDVGHGLLTDIFSHLQFHIAEPLVRIQPIFRCLLAQPRDTARTGVIAGKRK